MQAIIKTKNLTKYYGKTRGVEELNLEVKKGEIFGFLGPNGAGKTTTIRLLLHLIKPTSGEVFIFGKEVGRSYIKILGEIGYLSGDLNLYGEMTGKQLLKFAGSFYRNNFEKFQKEATEILGCELNKSYKSLSSGNKQKIGILLAIFHKPKLLILDEPTSGLDPLTQNEFYKLLFDLKEKGTTIFFSSHNLPEVEKVCDRVGIIREGRLADVETIDEIRGHRRKEVEIYFVGPYKKKDFSSIKDIEILEARKEYIRLFAKSSATERLIKILANYKIKDINFSYPDLEDVFLKYYGS